VSAKLLAHFGQRRERDLGEESGRLLVVREAHASPQPLPPRKLDRPVAVEDCASSGASSGELRGQTISSAVLAVRLDAKGFIQTEHDEDHNEAEREAHYDRGVLQRCDPADHEHREGEESGGDGPEYTDRVRGVVARRAAIRGEVAHDEGAGVGGGDVEKESAEGGDGGDYGEGGVLLEEGVKTLLGLVHRGLSELLGAAPHERDRGVSEDRDPHEDVQKRDDERPRDELPDGSSCGLPETRRARRGS